MDFAILLGVMIVLEERDLSVFLRTVMPRRRTTRNKPKRPGPTIPSGDEGTNIDVECRKEKVKTLIQDFENEGCILLFMLLAVVVFGYGGRATDILSHNKLRHSYTDSTCVC